MTILWAGTEDADFVMAGGASVITTAGHFRSGVRCALRVPTIIGPQTAYLRVNNKFSASDFWLSAWRYSNVSLANTGTATDHFMFRLLDTNGVVRLRLIPTLTQQSATSPWQLQKLDSTGAATNLATTAPGFCDNVLQKLDVHITYAVAGRIVIRAAKKVILDYSGDITTDSVTALSGFGLGTSSIGGSTTSSSDDWSEIIVSDSDTRSMTLTRVALSGAGASSQWNGATDGSTINETTMSDTDGIDTGTTAQTQLFTQSTTLSNSIQAVVLSATAMTAAGQPQHLRGVIRVGSTNYTSSNLNVSTFLDPVQAIFSTDPSTSAAFTGITGMQFGLQSQT